MTGVTHLHDFKFVKRFKWLSGRWHVLYRCRYCDRQIFQPAEGAR